MILGSIQRREVVVGRLDEGTVLHGIAKPHEDVLDLLADLADEMLRAMREATTRQRDVGRLGRYPSLERGLRKLLPSLADGRLDVGAHGVGELTHGRALLLGQPTHRAHDRRERTLLAQRRHAHLLEGLERPRLCKALLNPLLNRPQLIRHRHTRNPSPPNKNVPRQRAQGRMIRGTTLLAARTVSCERPLIKSRVVGQTASLFGEHRSPIPARTGGNEDEGIYRSGRSW